MRIRSILPAISRALGPALLAVALVVVPLLPALAADATITITSAVSPASLTVTPGTTVIFQNSDGERHRMRTVSGPEEFDTGNIEPGASASVTLDAEGTYSYQDERNDDVSGYNGTITVSAGGGGGGGGEQPPPAATGDVSMAGRRFSPSNVTISAGGSVKFVNDDDRDHTVTANDGSFDSGIMGTNATYTRTFAAAGTYPYFCALHPDMTGTVTVTGSQGEPPPPPAPTTTTTAPPGGGGGAPGDVDVFDYGYTPGSLQISVGSRVTFANTGRALHTVTDRAGRFDSGLISAGASYSRTFNEAGTFEYYCTLHPEMVATLVVSAGGSEPPPPPPPTTTTTAPPGGGGGGSGDVSMFDYGYRPASLQVTTGSRVTFANTGQAPHTVTDKAGRFDSGLVAAGASYSRTFNEAGTFNYYCTLHPQMVATLVVADPGGEPPPPPPPDEEPGPTATARAGEVAMRDFSYSPGRVTIRAGGSVTWVNTGQAPHTVTARNGSFDSGIKNAGVRYTRTFSEPGTFSYYCILHPQMTGTVVVTDASGVAPPEEELPTDTTIAPTAGGVATPTGPVSVDVIDIDYSPRRVEIAQGQEVVWTNIGVAPHTVTARDNSWTSELMQTGDVYRKTFDQIGSFEYYCTLHPTMVGTVVVNAAPEGVAGSTDGAEAQAAGILPETPSDVGESSGFASAIVLTVAALIAAGVVACVIVIWSALRPEQRTA